MLIDYRELSSVKRLVEVEIPSEAVSSEIKKVASDFGRQARIPGFRAGKVPQKVVKNRFMKEIQEEVVDRLLPRFFQQAVTEKKEAAIGNPDLKRMDPLVEGQPLTFVAEFEIKPTVELAEYKGIEIREPSVEVGEADIDQILERYREQSSFYRPVHNRPAEKDDIVVIDLISTADGMETQRSEDGHIKVGEASPIPELHEAILGKLPDDRFSFEKEYGDDVPSESFRGRTVRHEVTINEIRVQEKPELSDQFAKSVGTWDSLEEMRAKVGDDLKRHREQEAIRNKRDQLGEVLLSRHQFEVPDVMVEDELGKSLQNYARYLASQQVDLEKAGIDWMSVRKEFRPEAVKRVKRGLILDEIAKREGLVVSDLEVDAEIRKAAHEGRREFADVKHHLKHDGGYESLRLSLSEERALAMLLDHAVVTT
ncbi:MAG TPA: trigger factor [Thermoanaerobaculia bacterium]|nr:trigger factor [Thermoanaerobaculia bacterium]